MYSENQCTKGEMEANQGNDHRLKAIPSTDSRLKAIPSTDGRLKATQRPDGRLEANLRKDSSMEALVSLLEDVYCETRVDVDDLAYIELHGSHETVSYQLTYQQNA